MVKESLVDHLRRVDRVGYCKPIVVKPCRLKLYAIRFNDGQKDHLFSAMDDKEALDFTRDILSIQGKINEKKFEKMGAKFLLCADRQVFPPKQKAKDKK